MEIKREILFRGKSIYNNEWITGNLFISDTDDRYYILCGSRTVTIEYEVLPETIGQYTGLKDKNGNRMFENDIVKTKYGRIRSIWWFESLLCYGLVPVEKN